MNSSNLGNLVSLQSNVIIMVGNVYSATVLNEQNSLLQSF